MSESNQESQAHIVLGQKYAYETISLILGIACLHYTLLVWEKALLAVISLAGAQSTPSPILKARECGRRTGVVLRTIGTDFIPTIISLNLDRLRVIIETPGKISEGKMTRCGGTKPSVTTTVGRAIRTESKWRKTMKKYWLRRFYRMLITLTVWAFQALNLQRSRPGKPAAERLSRGAITLELQPGRCTAHWNGLNRAAPVPVVLRSQVSGPTDRDGNSILLKGRNNSLKLLAEGLAATHCVRAL